MAEGVATKAQKRAYKVQQRLKTIKVRQESMFQNLLRKSYYRAIFTSPGEENSPLNENEMNSPVGSKYSVSVRDVEESVRILPKGTPLYRVQSNAYDPKEGYPDTFKNYFTSSVAAALYGDNSKKNSFLYEITFPRDLHILTITDKHYVDFYVKAAIYCVDLLFTPTSSQSELKQNEQMYTTINNFFFILGLNPFLMAEIDWVLNLYGENVEFSKGDEYESFLQLLCILWEKDYTVWLLSMLEKEPSFSIHDGAFLPLYSEIQEYLEGATKAQRKPFQSETLFQLIHTLFHIEKANGVAENSAEGSADSNAPDEGLVIGGGNSDSNSPPSGPVLHKRKRKSGDSGEGAKAARRSSIFKDLLHTIEDKGDIYDTILKHTFYSEEGYQNLFRRVSSTEFDTSVFKALSNKEFIRRIENPDLRTLLENIDGIYIQAFQSPVRNWKSSLSEVGWFHEEFNIFPSTFQWTATAPVAPKKAAKKEKGTQRKQAKKPEFTVRYLNNYKDISKEIQYQCFRESGILYTGEKVVDPFLAADTPDIVRSYYIYLVDSIYNRISNSIEESIGILIHPKGDDLWSKGIFPYDDWAYAFATLLSNNRDSILLHFLRAIEHSFEIYPQFIVGDKPAKTPFLDDGVFNEELFYFTCLSDALKAFIKAYWDFLYDLNLTEFIPVASGGILFGEYTFGDYKRNTKDIDLKVVYDPSLEPDIEGFEQGTESYHEMRQTMLTLATNLFTTLLLDAFNLFGKMRIEKMFVFYIHTFPELAKHITRRVTGFTIGNSGNYQTLDILALTRSILFQMEPERMANNVKNPIRGNLFLIYNEVLKEAPIQLSADEGPLNSVAAVIQKKRQLLIAKREQQLKRSSRVAKTKLAAEAAITIINQSLKVIQNHAVQFIDFYGKAIKWTLPEDQAISVPSIKKESDTRSPLLKTVSYIQEKLSARPDMDLFTGGDPLKINYFSSLWINLTRKDGKEDRYGLIDFTFDTPYGQLGSYTYPSGIHVDALFTSPMGNFAYAPFLHFLKESDKLLSICSATYFGGDEGELNDYNPFNRCAPTLPNRVSKRRKYQARYDLVNNFCKEFLIPLLHSRKAGNPIKKMIYAIPEEAFQLFKPTEEEHDDLIRPETPLSRIIEFFEEKISGESSKKEQRDAERYLSILAAGVSRIQAGPQLLIGAGRRLPTHTRRVRRASRYPLKKTRRA